MSEKSLMCLGSIMYFFGVIMFVITRISREFWADVSTWEFLSMFGLFLLLGAGILLLGWWIGKRTENNC